MRLDKKNRLCGTWVLHMTEAELAKEFWVSDAMRATGLATSLSEAQREMGGTYLNKIDKEHRVGEDRPLAFEDFTWPLHPNSCFLATRRGKRGTLIVLTVGGEE